MASTEFLQALEQLREEIGRPMSHVEVARHAVMKQLAAINNVPMPAILDDRQRKVFMDNIDHQAGFLKSDDGYDAIELVVDAYKHYCEKMEAEEQTDEEVEED